MLATDGDRRSRSADDVVDPCPPDRVVQPGDGDRAGHWCHCRSFVQERLAYERLDGELERLMLTLEGVMRTEFGEGLDLMAAADEASIEVVAPDRSLLLTRIDGGLLEAWGRPLAGVWHPPSIDPGSRP